MKYGKALFWPKISEFRSFATRNPSHGVSPFIQSECRKIRTTKTPNTDTFHAVSDPYKVVDSICFYYSSETSKLICSIGRLLFLIYYRVVSQTLSNILDRAFCENSSWFSVVNNFRKKFHFRFLTGFWIRLCVRKKWFLTTDPECLPMLTHFILTILMC